MAFKNTYSVDEFESLVAQEKYQEAYLAAVLLLNSKIDLNEQLLTEVKMAVENQWPEIYDEKHPS